MSIFKHRSPKDSYKELLVVDNLGGIDPTQPKPIGDGNGVNTPLSLSSTQISLNGSLWPSGVAPAQAMLRMSGITNQLEWGTIKQSIRCTTVGALVVITGTMRLYPASLMTLDSIFASVNTASIGSDIKIDIKKNGVSILAGTYITVASTSNKSASVINSTVVTVNDYLTVDIIQVGSTTSGSDLVVTISYF